MKKSLFLVPLALGLFACSSENIVDNPTPDPLNPDDITTSYLRVNIIAASEGSSRADDLFTDSEAGDPTDAKYNKGNAAENKVNNVRFYFFDADGNAAPVKWNAEAGQYQSYYDISASTGLESEDEDNNPNVYYIVDSTIVIQSPNGDQVPASMIAIVNIPADGKMTELTTIAPSISQLNAATKDYNASTNGFVMSNSVYANENSKVKFEETIISKDKFKSTEDAAKGDPVDIFVERVVAKVSVDMDGMEGSDIEDYGDSNEDFTIYKVKKADGSDYTLADNSSIQQDPTGSPEEEVEPGENPGQIDVYVRFYGWNVTTTADIAHLMKAIDTSWTSESLGLTWTWPLYYRSFWAQNPSGVEHKYTDFNGENSEEDVANGQAIKGMSYAKSKLSTGAVPNYTYVNENTDPTNHTQVILPAQLVDEDGNPLLLAEFMGFKYLGANYETNVKKAIANIINVWVEKTDAGGTKTYTSIWEYIDFKTTNEMIAEKAQTNGSSILRPEDARDFSAQPKYYNWAVYNSAKTLGSDEKLVVLVDDEDAVDSPFEGETYPQKYEEIDYTKLKQLLEGIDPVKIWKDGMTYYYVDIKHLGSTGKTGEYGVVRNHWYDLEVSKVFGLGTPVYDPSDMIKPEKPNDDPHYLAARINILSWRIVKNENVELGK